MEHFNSSGITNQIFYRCVEDCFEPIMLTDRKGCLTYVNPAWILTYGYQKNEALGQTPRLLRSPQQSDEFYRTMWKTILDPQIGFWRGQVINQAKDGHLVTVLLTITPYREASGEISGYMGIAVDLSEQKKMEQQMIRQDRLASIGLLSGGLAHEIGNPLGAIRGRAEMLRSALPGNDFAEKNLDLIMNQIDRISGLIQSLLKVSRASDQILVREISLAESVDEVIKLLEETCRAGKIELRRGPLDRAILADPNHVQQIFLNLLLNSCHAIEEKSLRPEMYVNEPRFIEITAHEPKNGMCAVAIRDNGIGIGAENISKLFQPFFTTKAAGKGTGLGLAIVLKLLEEMKGRILVESPGRDQGTTFIVEFPVAQSPSLSAGSSS